jgi:hypothetical protein
MLDSAARIVVDLKQAPPGNQDLIVRLGLNDGRNLEVQTKINLPAAQVPPPPTPKRIQNGFGRR